ncbi:MAG: hypothetical protein ACHRHE_20585 [Tepidisphaerales bacterium]
MGLVPIEYGYMRFSKAYRELSITTFPNSARFCVGGCCVDADSPRHEWVWYCPACRYAEECWEKQPDSRKQAIKQTSDSAMEKLPDDANAWAALALQQTDDESIIVCLQYLRLSMMQSQDMGFSRRMLDAYARVAKKLEAGWPGFSGEIVSISGKKHRRRTEHDLLEREYVLWSSWLMMFNPPIYSEIHGCLAPLAEHRDLRDAWLRSAMSNPSDAESSSFRPAASASPSAPRSDARGNRFEQVSDSIAHVPIRRILVTRPDGTRFSFATFLVDDTVATAEQMIALCEREREAKAKDPEREVDWAFWLR